MKVVAWLAALAGCNSGPPSPDGIVVASDSQPWQLVNDGTNLYWTEYSGGIRATPLDAVDAPPTQVVDRTAAQDPGALAVDGTSIYWAEADGFGASTGSIEKLALGGGPPITLVPSTGVPYSLALDATRVFWTNGSQVWAVPIAGGLIERIAIAEASAELLAVDGVHAYWSNSSQHAIRSLDLTDLDAIPQTIAATQFVGALAIDATYVYWIDYDNVTARILKAPLAGGDPIALSSYQMIGISTRPGIGVDDKAVYWTTDNEIRTVSLDGMGEKTLAGNNSQVVTLTVGPTDVYWVSDQQIRVSQAEELDTTAIRKTAK